MVGSLAESERGVRCVGKSGRERERGEVCGEV